MYVVLRITYDIWYGMVQTDQNYKSTNPEVILDEYGIANKGFKLPIIQ